jgi:hypothetical protein
MSKPFAANTFAIAIATGDLPPKISADFKVILV